ncbi:MAG: alpha-L-fucosidase, partial [Defluviitaleaceae bacterium]|nr:alpha-L-fucosidase [Defluviitaleaceae bacterium]
MDITRFTAVRPHERQIMWQELGFTAFLHFGMNTFTNREWGEGDESPDIYAPAALNTDQWCEALRPAGIKACILTAKHHDGFCLWDTAYTRHGVMSSSVPVDVAASLAASCRRYGMKLGIYLSPWDRHEPSYGTGKPYDDFFCGQLDELTTQYGELYCCWFDGACGEKNGKVQNYDWERYFSIIRKNQPNAVISVMGPDVRWIGNEAGLTRKSEWSVVSTRLQNSGAIAARSQQADGLPPLSLEDEDLGSAAALENEPELCWYPAEVNVSIRPGWFYHPEENGCLRSVADLLGIYEASVGGNALLLLNVPPDKNGQINGADALRLKELGEALSAAYGRNLCLDAI